jgi:tRNA dimethylallyltransferase
MSEKERIICVCGPTASGKSALGIVLALDLGGEVISCDSMQVYRGMDIGTAKPGPAEIAVVPHHMIDVADPFEDYSAARYAEEAASCITGVISRGKLPIVVGGTGLYFDALIKGGDYSPKPDPAVREELSALARTRGGEYLFSMLKEQDPQSAARLHVNDTKRIIRALEVKIATGITLSEHNERSRSIPPRYEAVMIGLDFEHREALYDRINRRVDEMFARGLVGEVASLIRSGVSDSCTAMQAIGYKETAAYLRGECTLDGAVEAVKLATRRYAKRQLTWFRRYGRMKWIIQPDTPDPDEVRRLSTQYALSSEI